MNLTELCAILDNFVKIPDLSQWDPICENVVPVLMGGVRDYENLESARLLKNLGVLLDGVDASGLASHPRFDGKLPQIAERLIHNLRRLVATAEIAFELSKGDLPKNRAGEAVLTLKRLFQDVPCNGDSAGNLSQFTGLSQGGTRAVRLLDRYAGTWPAGAALYWILFWLQDETYLTEGEMSAPVIGVPNLEGDIPILLRLLVLKETYNSALVEHPRTALVTLGPDLMSAMERAFALGGPGRLGAAWQLETVSKALHDDRSLTGAAAAMLRLCAGRSYSFDSDCLILADVGEDGETLVKVAQLPDKLRDCLKLKVSCVVLPESARAEFEPYTFDLKQRGRTVAWASTLTEACTFASGTVGFGIAATNGQKVLDKYVLDRCLDAREQLWLGQESGRTGTDGKVLLKLWETPLEDPSGNFDLGGTRWRRELRVAYRLSSSPGAEECLMRLRDAQMEPKSFGRKDRRAYVIVLAADRGGYDQLSALLTERAKVPWLAQTYKREERNPIWRGLRRIARGIHLVHKQRVLHHNVRAESIFCDRNGTPESFRLGGYEWAMRLGDWELEIGGRSADGDQISGWICPPEAVDRTASWAADWYGLGMTAARILLNLERLPATDGKKLNQLVRDTIRESSLSGREKELLLSLTHPNESKRPQWEEVDGELHLLEQGVSLFEPGNHGKLCVFIDVGAPQPATKLAEALGKVETNATDRDVLLSGFQPSQKAHLQVLQRCLRRDLREARVASFARHTGDGYAPEYCLAGSKLSYVISPFYADTGKTDDQRWAIAKLSLRSKGAAVEIGIDQAPHTLEVAVYLREADLATPAIHESRPWTDVLPLMSAKDEIPKDWLHLQQFLRLTNQIELLMRRDEIFRYTMDPLSDVTVVGLTTYVRLYENRAEKATSHIYSKAAGMVVSIARELERGGWDSDRVMLHPNAEEPKLWERKGETWQVCSPGTDRKENFHGDLDAADYLLVARTGPGTVVPPSQGFVRVAGHHGQISLIHRRQDAIDRLSQHGYLMRALTNPHEVYLDTSSSLAQAPIGAEIEDRKPDAEQLDKISLITGTRPIFLLNGPPGTGKSTLVAYTLGAILKDDPAAQILVTAQSHGAVDALRQTIRKERTLETEDASRHPIEIRLGARGVEEQIHKSDRFQVASGVLDQCEKALSGAPPQTAAGREWRNRVAEMRAEVQRLKTLPENPDLAAPPLPPPAPRLARFVDMVEESANVVYATSSAGDLTELAKGDRWFDWTIVEEAGKAHGFDLALPLGSGHRWLLLGDRYQLFPYRLHDFDKAIAHMPELRGALERLRPANRELVDRKLLSWLDGISESELADFKRMATMRLRTFSHLRTILQTSDTLRERQTSRIVRPSCDDLTNQYRMHKSIADLVSAVYYRDSPLTTKDNRVKKQHGLVVPAKLKDVAILWLDLPWGSESTEARGYLERRYPPRWNDQEIASIRRLLAQLSLARTDSGASAEVGVLSPYAQQVQQLHRALNPALRPGLKYRQGLTAGSESLRRAHTVDSFQGNEADIVCISLVRNNRNKEPQKALGFLSEAERMNVLISRASRLLVLAGCWEFFEKNLEFIDPDDPDLGHLKRLLEELEKLFARHTALRLPIEALV